MDVQEIIAGLLALVAAWFVGRHVWAEVRGLIRPSEAGGCPGCDGCEAAEPEQLARKGVRPAPELKMTPLIRLSSRPPHRPSPRAADEAPEPPR